ncbi:hypothetical protein ACFL27_04785 [candidate division CSSED10-310 bacterium]|uniref:Rubrerythrin diiron-binding domain-containing protein n=1 Tax=candidate division CSSED10-310 bacterium TaxID=2855610 RepID=A0ABV6YTV7_UNCC1
MELTTFGAIMKFAMDREKSLQTLVEKTISSDAGQVYLELLQSLLSDCKKSLKLLERTRREGINEMVLLPISDLEETPYLDPEHPETFEDAQAMGLCLEMTLDRITLFYQAAAAKLPNETASKAFNRLADKKLKLLKSIQGKLCST